ncbi:putative porin [Flavitalea flava]
MKGSRIITTGALAILFFFSLSLRAQNPLGRFQNMGGGGGGKSGAGDTLQHRKADTITLNYRYLDSSRLLKLDSSILDFSKKVPLPRTWINLGNMGTPAKDLVFSPRMQSGWDPGWHAYDLYKFKVEDTKFYNTTKPYTELGYLLGSKAEQVIDVQHTQNITPNWNFAFEYRLINSTGAFVNQNTTHNNYRLSSWYRSKSKRYQAFFILVGSKLIASDNGGLRNNGDLDSVSYANQFTLPVWIGNNVAKSYANIFGSTLTAGTRTATGTYLLRQQYDLGQKDSVVTDSTIVQLFYPRVRIEHTIYYNTHDYSFMDQASPASSYVIDSFYYASRYQRPYINPTDTIFRRDKWKELTNDFSLYQFPDSKNPQQFFKAGATLQLLKAVFDTAVLSSLIPPGNQLNITHKLSTYNAFLHGEYRNKTRNQKWDVEAYGKFYLNGLNAGDYNAFISLKRYVSRQVGYLQVGFENANKTPSFVYDQQSSFYSDTLKSTFAKENTTHIFAALEQPQHKMKLSGSYFLMSNYSYYQDYFKQRQASLFNLLQISIEKEFSLTRHWKWRTQTILQQIAGSSPVHVPLLVSHNQVGYDGTFGFKNLIISFGTEIRYVTGYKADGYAPLTGQFFSQSDTTIRQHLPDISLYMHFRIRSFTAYLRGENLNSIAFSPHGFGWYRNNFVTPTYPSPGLLLRFGFFWGFVN